MGCLVAGCLLLVSLAAWPPLAVCPRHQRGYPLTYLFLAIFKPCKNLTHAPLWKIIYCWDLPGWDLLRIPGWLLLVISVIAELCHHLLFNIYIYTVMTRGIINPNSQTKRNILRREETVFVPMIKTFSSADANQLWIMERKRKDRSCRSTLRRAGTQG